MTDPTEDARDGRSDTVTDERRRDRSRRDDWHRRHTRTSPSDDGSTPVVREREEPEDGADWHARHGHVRTLADR